MAGVNKVGTANANHYHLEQLPRQPLIRPRGADSGSASRTLPARQTWPCEDWHAPRQFIRADTSFRALPRSPGRLTIRLRVHCAPRRRSGVLRLDFARQSSAPRSRDSCFFWLRSALPASPTACPRVRPPSERNLPSATPLPRVHCGTACESSTCPLLSPAVPATSRPVPVTSKYSRTDQAHSPGARAFYFRRNSCV